MKRLKRKYNEIMARIVGWISPLWSFLTEWTGRLYWLAVLGISYPSPWLAQKLAIRWLDKLREKIVNKHRSNPEAINHLGKQPEDNIPFMLGMLSRFKSQCREHFLQVRTAARIHMKGRGLIIGRKLKWEDQPVSRI